MTNNKINVRCICDGKWVGEIPRGIGFGSPDASACFQYAQNAGSADILKIAKPRSSDFSEKTVFANNRLYRVKTTNRKDGNDRKDHEEIKCCHQNMNLRWYLPINFMFLRNPGSSIFCTAYSFHHVIMFWLEGAEVERPYSKRRTIIPAAPGVA